MAWEIIRGCRWQLRMGMNGPVGLDFGAVMALAAARGAATAMLAEVLPDIEPILLLSLKGEGEDEE